MLSRYLRRQKDKRLQEAELGDTGGSSPQQSVTAEDPEHDIEVPYTLSVSAPPKPPKEKTKKSWRRWFKKKTRTPKTPVEQDKAGEANQPSAIQESEGGEAEVKEALPNPETTQNSGVKKADVQEAAPCQGIAEDDCDAGEAKIEEPSPIDETFKEEAEDETSTSPDIKGEDEGEDFGVQEASTSPDAPVSAAPENKKKSWWRWPFFHGKKQNLEPQPAKEEGERQSAHPEGPMPHLTATGQGGSLCSESPNISLMASAQASVETLSSEELVRLGFPNLGQTCYMNSTLQGLLTVTPFVQEVYNQQLVWKAHPKPELFRGFVNVGLCRLSDDEVMKCNILEEFKMSVAECNSEFDDDDQKDAHEFLCCVLSEMTSHSFDLQATAVGLGLSYTCPVEAHIAFKMMSRRTCKGCGSQSTRYEDFINLSLDLTQVRSVSQCLEKYLEDSNLEFTCKCKHQESSQKWSFLTLPNVLVLQLQRFRFTPSFRLVKVASPIKLSRELVLSPEASNTEETSTRYSLVSMVSHLGSKADFGHYICDGAHRQQKPDVGTDRWLTYNDDEVTETTGQEVCHHRRKSAYLLFYEKQQNKKEKTCSSRGSIQAEQTTQTPLQLLPSC